MSIITKESIADTIEGLELLANRGIQSVHIDMAIAGMRRLLESLEAEPVAWRHFQETPTDGGYWIINDYKPNCSGVEPLYTAPPAAPVSVPAAMEMDDDFDSAFEHGKAVGWNACRSAMPQGAEHVSNRDELPLGYLQGHKDGLEWAAQLAEANHPQTGDWLYDDPIELAKAIRKGPDMPEADGNSPVIQDGSEDTKRLDWLDAQNKRLNEYYGTTYGWKFDANFQRNAMMLNDSNYPVMTVRQAIDEAIAAAPQQEVKP